MTTMADAQLAQNVQVRTVGGAKHALDLVVASLRSTGRLRFRGRKVTQEAVVNALWLAAADVEVERLERWLAPYFARLEDILRAPTEASPGVLDDPFPGPSAEAPVAKHEGPPESRYAEPLQTRDHTASLEKQESEAKKKTRAVRDRIRKISIDGDPEQ